MIAASTQLALRGLETVLGRLVAALLVYFGTFCCYSWLNTSLRPQCDLLTPLDLAIPFLPWTLPVYLSFIGLMLIAVWRGNGREFARLIVAVVLANLVCYAGFALYTAHFPRPALESIDSWWRPFYASLRESDGPGNTFPSTHVATSLLLASWLNLRTGARGWFIWAAAICVATVTTKQHFVADVVGGALVALLVHVLVLMPAPARVSQDEDPRIRHRFNLGLTCAVTLGAWALQALAARQTSVGSVVALGVLFAILQTTIYSLLHEAWHRVLHPDSRYNDLFGFVLASLFPCSFTFLRACHLGHHGRNRTDSEMFDLYYPGENLLKRRATFYFAYFGAFWAMIAGLNVVLALWEGFCRTKLVQSTTSAAAMIRGVPRSLVLRVRLESFGVIAVQGLCFWLLDLKLWTWFTLYAMHGLAWSAQNYITHAGTRRHVTDGAHNLATHWLHEKLILNFNWHLAHHQNPDVPWHLLPTLQDPDRPRVHYLAAFLRFWRGPQLATEPSPKVEPNRFFANLPPDHEAMGKKLTPAGTA